MGQRMEGRARPQAAGPDEGGGYRLVGDPEPYSAAKHCKAPSALRAGWWMSGAVVCSSAGFTSRFEGGHMSGIAAPREASADFGCKGRRRVRLTRGFDELRPVVRVSRLVG